MGPLRRLLATLLLVALAQFGMASVAPAHAHLSDSSHAGASAPVEVLGVSVVAEDVERFLRGQSHSSDDDHGATPDRSGTPDAPASEPLNHVHVFPQFDALNVCAYSVTRVSAAADWLAVDAVLTSLTAPPLQRPPSIIL